MTEAITDHGNTISVAGWETNYYDVGQGEPVLFLHGSGPGVSAFTNWQGVIPALADDFRCIAPDMVGWGDSARPNDIAYGIETWVEHIIGFLDALGVESTSIVGNSLGGRIALGIARSHPERVRRLVLMGSAGPQMVPTEGLKALRSYEPSMENMRNLLKYLVYDKTIVTEELVRDRYEASALPNVQKTYHAMFHEPPHTGTKPPLSSDELAEIQPPTLLVHGRDDEVVPLQNSFTLVQLMPNAQLHVFSDCGHWVQVEKADGFTHLVRWFLEAA